MYRWAKYKCEKNKHAIKTIRSVLGDILKLIRFGTMTSAEFTKCLCPDDEVLKSEEIIQIFKAIADRQSPCDYSKIAREQYDCKAVFFKGKKSNFLYSGHDYQLNMLKYEFVTNKAIKINGCYTYGCNITVNKHRSFTIALKSEDKLITSTDSCYLLDESDEPKLHTFIKPIFLEANKKYTI